jgi:hypothetical protein
MATITRNTELSAPRRGCHTPERAEACTLDAVGAVSHVEVIRRFCTFTLTVALLAITAAGIVAMKSAIWISCLSH